MNNLEKLIRELQKIAYLNDDDFKYRININLINQNKEIEYEFECLESADSHTFLNGFGKTPEMAANNTWKDIDDACEEWGYQRS